MKKELFNLEVFISTRRERQEYKNVLSYLLRLIAFEQLYCVSAVYMLADLVSTNETQFVTRIADYHDFNISLVKDLLKIRQDVKDNFIG